MIQFVEVLLFQLVGWLGDSSFFMVSLFYFCSSTKNFFNMEILQSDVKSSSITIIRRFLIISFIFGTLDERTDFCNDW